MSALSVTDQGAGQKAFFHMSDICQADNAEIKRRSQQLGFSLSDGKDESVRVYHPSKEPQTRPRGWERRRSDRLFLDDFEGDTKHHRKHRVYPGEGGGGEFWLVFKNTWLGSDAGFEPSPEKRHPVLVAVPTEGKPATSPRFIFGTMLPKWSVTFENWNPALFI